MTMFLDIVFDGPPGPESGRFVEVENQQGRSVNVGEWIQRPDGFWVLRFNSDSFAQQGERVGMHGRSAPLDLSVELQKIYDSEINVRVDWLWDGGIDLKVGDEMNGFVAEENVHSVAEIVRWFQEAIAHFYRGSTYAQTVGKDVKVKAAARLFTPIRRHPI